MTMQRVVPVPDAVPNGWIPVIMVFAEDDGNKGNTQLACHASEELLGSLQRVPMAKRMRAIKEIVSNIEQMLLQYSSNPDDFKVREITGHC